METWAAAFILLGNQFRDMGLKGTQGVEAVLRNAFTRQGKPIGELESNLRAAGLLRHASRKSPARSSSKARSNARGGHERAFHEMLPPGSRGDVEGDRPDLQPRPRRSPELQQALIKRRNANWTKWIEQRDDAAGRADDRGRRGPSRRQGFGRSICSNSDGYQRPPRPIGGLPRSPLSIKIHFSRISLDIS